MIFKMDTDAVRGLAARFRRSAGRMESSLSSIRQSVSSASWQSQAREEYIQQLELLHDSTLHSAEILSLMGTAAQQKANQWEAIANRFNAPWVAMSGIWNQLKSLLGWMWSRIKDAFGRIRLPSVPQFVGGSLVGVGAFTFSPLLVVGGLYVINPDWFQEKPLWWPFKPKPEPVPQPLPIPEPQPVPDLQPETPMESKSERPFPQPPNKIKLNDVTEAGSSYTCATYAKARRPDLGSTGPKTEEYPLGAAANYRIKFSETAFQVNQSDGSLTDTIGPGYAVVWDPKHPYADDTYGHVAIVEAVYPDHIVISEAVRNKQGVYYIRQKTVSYEELNNNLVWLIP